MSEDTLSAPSTDSIESATTTDTIAATTTEGTISAPIVETPVVTEATAINELLHTGVDKTNEPTSIGEHHGFVIRELEKIWTFLKHLEDKIESKL